MALVPIIFPPVIRLFTTKKERLIKMEQLREVSKKEKILFPIIVTLIVAIIVPTATHNDQAKREEIYKQIQDIVLEEAPYILLYQKDFILPISKNVKGFVYNPMLEGMYNLEEMSK